MRELLPIRLKAVVLDCQDIQALSDFYIRMLGWENGLFGGRRLG